MKCKKCERNTNVSFSDQSICFACFSGKSLKIYSSISKFLEKRNWTNYFQGYLVSPSYSNEIKFSNKDGLKMPYVVDNGAFTDYKKGILEDPLIILERTLSLCDKVIESSQEVRFMILPDYIGNWQKTYVNLKNLESISYFGYDHKTALPIQEGFVISQIEELIERHKPSILFIGGKDMKFKRFAVKELSKLKINCHVGRVHKVSDLCYFANQDNVESVDTSAFCRPFNNEKLLGYRLEAFHAWLFGYQKTLELLY